MPHFLPINQLEPGACSSFEKTGATIDSAIGAEAIQLSLAISMKRIADLFEKQGELVVDGEPIVETLEQIEISDERAKELLEDGIAGLTEDAKSRILGHGSRSR